MNAKEREKAPGEYQRIYNEFVVGKNKDEHSPENLGLR